MARVMTDTATKARQRLARWRDSVELFAWEEFGVEFDPWQKEAAGHWDAGRQRLAMKACKGPGKTAFLAIICWHFLVTRPHPKIAATSITSDNLSDGLWTEIAKWRSRSKTGVTKHEFEWTKTRIFYKHHPETWWMSARTWSKSASKEQQADTLAGLHADYILFVLDESGGIPDAVMAAAEAALSTGIEMRLVQAGNPTHLEGPLYRAVTIESDLWAVVEITGDPEDPNRSPRISVDWANQQISKYGRDNPWVMVNVFGKFPPSSVNALLGPDDMSAAIGRHLTQDVYEWAPKILGVDVARFGDDRTVIFPRQGLAAFQPVIMRNAKTQQIAARVATAYDKWRADAIFVDGTGGYGAGVVDRLEEAGYPVVEVNFSEKAKDPRYYNLRAEMHFDAAEWVRKGGALPTGVPELSKEATAFLYSFKRERLIVLDKDQIKQETGESPDHWDAFALTFAQPVAARKPAGMTFGAPDHKLPGWEP